jgi:hypothetical protein
MRIAIAGAVKLKRTLGSVCFRIQRDPTSESITTVIVPAAGPNISTEVNTNVSDTDNLAGRDGSLTVNEPVNNVSAARTKYSTLGGFEENSQNELATTPMPQITTAAT